MSPVFFLLFLSLPVEYDTLLGRPSHKSVETTLMPESRGLELHIQIVCGILLSCNYYLIHLSICYYPKQYCNFRGCLLFILVFCLLSIKHCSFTMILASIKLLVILDWSFLQCVPLWGRVRMWVCEVVSEYNNDKWRYKYIWVQKRQPVLAKWCRPHAHWSKIFHIGHDCGGWHLATKDCFISMHTAA